jgi:GT2 family glycosyltransferase
MINKKLVPRVLIGIPTYEGKNYCLDAFIQNISKFTYPKSRLGIYIADNSKDNKNAIMISRKYGIKCFWRDYTGYSVNEKLADSHNQVRQYALDEGYDYLFHLESDVFPQADIIQQLIWCRKTIVCGLYQVFDGAWRTPCIKLMDNKHEHSREFTFFTDITNYHHWFIDGKLKKTHIAGIGCALIKKNVLFNFPFRSDKNINVPPDSWFAQDLQQAGVQNWVHTGLLAYHWNKEDWGRHSEYMKYHKSE